MKKGSERKSSQTFINWISVHDQLPPAGKSVLGLDEEQCVFATTFNPENGWDGGSLTIKFWSNYNLPK